MKKLLLVLALTFVSTALVSVSPVVASDSDDSDPDEEFRIYCDRILSQLQRARSASDNAVVNGRFSDAFKALKVGLKQSRQNYGAINPIAFNLIGHALNVGETLERTMGTDVKTVKAATIVLEGFYDLIFDTAYNLDYVYYRCSSYRRSCRHSQTLEFERNVVEMVSNMLSLSNSSLLISRNGQVFPLGPSSVYLKATEVITYAAYFELRNMVTSTSYSCEILDLKEISNDLTSFNSISSQESVRRDKIYQVYSDLNGVIYSLSYPNCSR